MEIIEIRKGGYNLTYPRDKDQRNTILKEINKKIKKYKREDVTILNFEHRTRDSRDGLYHSTH